MKHDTYEFEVPIAHNPGTMHCGGSSGRDKQRNRTEQMSTVEFEDGAVSVDAAIIAEEFAIAPALVQRRMREGKITSLCERGVDEDAGRHRLTFFYGKRRLHLLVDEAGTIIERTTTGSGDH